MGVSRAAETFLLSRCKHTPHPPPPRFMYLLNSGAETLFVVPGVPKQLGLPSNTSDSKERLDNLEPPIFLLRSGRKETLNRGLMIPHYEAESQYKLQSSDDATTTPLSLR